MSRPKTNSRAGRTNSTTNSTVGKGNMSGNSDEEESWTCEMCENVFVDDNDEVVQCGYCNLYYCASCLKLTKKEYKQYMNPALYWYCPQCEAKVKKNNRSDREVEVRCAEFLKVMEGRIEKLEKDMTEKVDAKTVQDIMSCKVDEKRVQQIVEDKIKALNIESGATNVTEIEEAMNRKIAELRDSESRVRNIIVHGIMETDDNDSAVRKEKDTAYIRDLAEFISSDSSAVQNVVRVGIRRDVTNASNSVGSSVKPRPRPVKIMMKNVESKKNFMRNLPKLRQIEPSSKFADISVSQDMTQGERELHREKVSEAKAKNEKETMGNYRHVVRGPPWDKRTVRLRVEK
jgi:hypothetical protein